MEVVMRFKVKKLLQGGVYLIRFESIGCTRKETRGIRKFGIPTIDLSSEGLGVHRMDTMNLSVKCRDLEEADYMIQRVTKKIRDELNDLSARKNSPTLEKVWETCTKRKNLVLSLACAFALAVVSAFSGVISSERTDVRDQESAVPARESNLISEKAQSFQEGADASSKGSLAEYRGQYAEHYTGQPHASSRSTGGNSGYTNSIRPDFTITPVPKTLARYTEWGSDASGALSQGESRHFKLILTPLEGFEGPVTLGFSSPSSLLDLRLYPTEIEKLPGSSTLLVSFPPNSVPQVSPDITIVARGKASDGTLITHEKKLALAIRQKSSYQGPAWHVSPHGSDQSGDGGWGSPFKTIQRAIDCARSGDTVLVEVGLYEENISLCEKDGLVITSHFLFNQDESTVESTIIQGKDQGWVVTIGRSHDVALCGFTVQNGRGRKGSLGGGIYCFNSTPTIFNNVVTGNENQSGYGAGIFCYDSKPAILWNHVTKNFNYEGHGAGIYCYGSDPDIRHNVISGNRASGGGSAIHLLEPKSAKIIHNTIHGDSGCAAVVLYKSGVRGDFQVLNNTISHNQGDAIRFFGGPWHFENNIVTNNEGYGLFTLQGVGYFSYNDVWGNGRGGDTLNHYGLSEHLIGNSGNISADPRFGNPPHGNFQLCVDSPCIDAGDPSVPVPFDGGRRIDMGAFEYTHPDAISGDVNRDGYVDYGDVDYLVKFLSGRVPSPDPLEIADVNCDDEIDGRDLGHLYRFLYYYGEEPCTDFKLKGRLTER
jgi:hypothetical protein